MAEGYGFEVLSFADYDYEPYYLKDIMHMGWLGWYYVDEKIADYFE
jgi:D-alanine transfer protein